MSLIYLIFAAILREAGTMFYTHKLYAAWKLNKNNLFWNKYKTATKIKKKWVFYFYYGYNYVNIKSQKLYIKTNKS